MRNGGYTFLDRIPPDAEGTTVLDYYATRHMRADREEWRRRIEAGRVVRRGLPLGCDDGLREGDRLEYHRPPWDEPDVPLDAPLLHQDCDLLVFHKPAGLPVLPGAGCQDNTLLGVARRRFGPSARPVHRLDTGTSGAIAFARSAQSARHLCQAFASRQVCKTYLARVIGIDLPDRLTLDRPIGRVPYPPLGFVSGVAADGRPSLTEVEVLRREAESGESVVQVRIATGRSQQIRVHLAFAGFPLAGDRLYGPGGTRPPIPGEACPKPGDGGYLLHSWKLVLPRRDGSVLAVVAPPPEGLRARDGEPWGDAWARGAGSTGSGARCPPEFPRYEPPPADPALRRPGHR